MEELKANHEHDSDQHLPMPGEVRIGWVAHMAAGSTRISHRVSLRWQRGRSESAGSERKQ